MNKCGNKEEKKTLMKQKINGYMHTKDDKRNGKKTKNQNCERAINGKKTANCSHYIVHTCYESKTDGKRIKKSITVLKR